MTTNIIFTGITITELESIIDQCIGRALDKRSISPKTHEETYLITESELSKRLKRSKVTLYIWRKKGILPFYRISRKIYFRWDEVLSALNKIERRVV